jgi:polyhydroxybutyrate depolymerase
MLAPMRTLAAATLALLLPACGGGDDGPPVERPTEFGGARPVSLQVPTDFDDTRSYPLLVILHGYGASGFLQQSYLRLGDAADGYDTLVLAPEGTKDTGGSQFWNADPACCDFGQTGVDDVAYVGGLIDDVMAAWPVDPARVALLGHSNGAFMAYRMACARADAVTAIAGLAGHATSSAVPCAPTDPVNVLHLHGTADDTVPYESGSFGGVRSPGAVESVGQWATRNGCAGALAPAGTAKDLDTGVAGAETEVQVTSRCPAGGAADLWTIDQGGHIPSIGEGFPAAVMAWIAAHPRT